MRKNDSSAGERKSWREGASSARASKILKPRALGTSGSRRQTSGLRSKFERRFVGAHEHDACRLCGAHFYGGPQPGHRPARLEFVPPSVFERYTYMYKRITLSYCTSCTTRDCELRSGSMSRRLRRCLRSFAGKSGARSAHPHRRVLTYKMTMYDTADEPKSLAWERRERTLIVRGQREIFCRLEVCLFWPLINLAVPLPEQSQRQRFASQQPVCVYACP